MDKATRIGDRKQEFLMAALELFHDKGYEKTTIQDIIDKMGVSKGAFYHYFESKEDILEKIAREYVVRGIMIMRKAANREDLNAMEKINNMIDTLNEYKGNREKERIKIKGLFKGDKNLKLERKIENAIKQDALSIFQQILDRAVEEGLIEKSNTRELAEFTAAIISIMDTSIDRLMEDFGADRKELCSGECLKRLEEKLDFYEAAFARVYNLPGRPIRLRESYLRRFAGKNM